MSDLSSGFEEFRMRQTRLLNMVAQSQGIFRSLEMMVAANRASELMKKIRSDSFKLLILGNFKRGKSTFINALLGDEILPAYAIPCTAVINEIKWGEEKKAVIHFRDPLPTPLPAQLSVDTVNYIKRFPNSSVPPMEVAIDDLENYVVIPDATKDQGESVSETPYEKVEIYWPIEICQNGIMIIDSPGLNEHHTRSEITKNYLQQVDAVVFVMSCHALAGLDELNTINRDIRGAGHEDLFFVCNRFDEIREKEKQRLVHFGRTKLGDLTNFGTDGVYFISALDALEGRMENNPQIVERSGMLPLENHLTKFLINDRGRIKLFQPAKELTQLLNQATMDVIPAKTAMLNENMNDLERRYTAAKPQLENTEKRCHQIIEKLDIIRRQIREDAKREFTTMLKDMAWRVPGWLEKYEPENDITFISMEGHQKQSNRLIKEVSEHVSGRIEDAMSNWMENNFKPFLADRLTTMGEEINDKIRVLLNELDGLRSSLSGIEASKSTKDIHPIERVLAAAGALAWGDYGAGIVGSVFGVKAMVMAALPNFGLVVGLVLLGFTNPAVWVGAMMASGAVQGWFRARSLTKKVIAQAAKEISQKLVSEASQRAEEMAKSLDIKIAEISVSINTGLKNEIQKVREQVEAVLATKQKGEGEVAQQRDVIKQAGAQIKQQVSQLNDLVFLVAGSKNIENYEVRNGTTA